jgi:hypothetical protein
LVLRNNAMPATGLIVADTNAAEGATGIKISP